MILNVGSINIDLVYRVPHLVRPGETLAAEKFTRNLGGKGANQSIAAAKAGASVMHCGAVGYDGHDYVKELADAGVSTDTIEILSEPTGHAVVAVDAEGENSIMLFAGANHAIADRLLDDAFADIGPDDWVMLQNEVQVNVEAAVRARGKGASVVYSAAPFDPDAVMDILPFITHLLLNEIENAALDHLSVPVPDTIIRVVTQGAAGATWLAQSQNMHVAAFDVPDVLDTTGAGDCFAGNLVAALERGMSPIDAVYFAQAAAAIQITRNGAAPAMPSRAEIEAFLAT
ncbi:MAG: ribokinase [Pseudomonadota bacterium]